MKLTFYAICALGVIISNFGCTSAGDRAVSASAPSAPAEVTVDFVDPGRFTDFRINNRDFQQIEVNMMQRWLQTLRVPQWRKE
jgi:hypothetical protein